MGARVIGVASTDEKRALAMAAGAESTIDPLTEESESVFAFPADRGMYHGEKLVFTRDAAGLHVTVDGNPRVMQTLPAVLNGKRIRRCDP